ncbi:DUF2267 domain-containing protein [Nocardia huaxiensis]|uniref:DUF2267 domain-containing protein n=1 Tax=Nocardia huaxiensis TaxID=2755382 RepID=UPI001E5A0E41|nr:DUF2267 domain-containing protein [Nocardia huaxiensis]UFS97930.1 DUF2267 domain-containing protein [Nocardia huaxiensis]
MSHHTDPFAPAVHTAHEWLAVVDDRLGDAPDRAFAHRALRAWLHTVRDRLGVSASAHLAAQLPELLRGIFYEGWIPAHVLVHHDVSSFLAQFSREAGVSVAQAVPLVGAVTDALAELFSPGALDHVLAQIPVKLRVLLIGVDTAEIFAGAGVFTPPAGPPIELEQRVRALSAAVAVLARGLETLPGVESDDAARASAAQQAHRILLAEGLTGPAARAH